MNISKNQHVGPTYQTKNIERQLQNESPPPSDSYLSPVKGIIVVKESMLFGIDDV